MATPGFAILAKTAMKVPAVARLSTLFGQALS